MNSLQSPQGFWKAGGFRGIYRGIGASAIGSAPGASLFFSVYEKCKPIIMDFQTNHGLFVEYPFLSHMVAACTGETAACLVRVPTEVLKTNMQANVLPQQNLRQTFQLILQQNKKSIFGGLYRGFGTTLMREIPFAFVQFPIYEYLKTKITKYQRYDVSPLQAATCGSFGGSIAAALTTPLDVIKTRLMLGKDKHGVFYKGPKDVFTRSLKEEGYQVFWKGIQPRVLWISIGGFVFFGSYETAVLFLR